MQVKNNTNQIQVWAGKEFDPDEVYQIPSGDLFKWQSSDKVTADLTTLDLLIGDGSSYKASASEAVAFLLGVDSSPKDASGRTIIRTAASVSGWRAEFHSFRVTTSTGVHSKNRDGSDTGLCAFSMLDAQGAVTTDPGQCVESILYWEPTYNIEIVGATAMQSSPPASDIYLHVTLAPDVSPQYGGCVEFTIGGINLVDIGIGGIVDFDGRASKLINYNAQYHSGKWEFRFKHGAGVSHSITLLMELFRA